jgi:hypothetical protein
MNNNKSNFIGTIKVDINLYDANNNEFSIQIINDDNDHLINRINNDLKMLDIIRNNNRIKMYEDIIKENQELINESVTRKKQDILDVAKYMITKEKEILYYKQQIEELNTNINNLEISSVNNLQIDNENNKDTKIDTAIENKEIKDSIIDSTIDNKSQCDVISIFNNTIENKESYKVHQISNNIINLKNNELNCIIEIKDCKKNIGKNDIKKYINTFINNHSYNCGIFISLYSTYTSNSNIKDFDIMTINNKPVIFISNFNKDTNKIKYSIKIIQSILKYKINNNINNEEINTYINLINQYYDILECNIDNYDSKITKYNDKLSNYANKIENTKNKLESIILKKKDYIDNLKVLESIPTLQLGMLENGDINHDDYVNVKNENVTNNEIQDNISEIYSETFSNNSATPEESG